jgi:hypothetical protein
MLKCGNSFINPLTMENFILSPITLDLLSAAIREIVRSELHSKGSEDANERLLSPAETCKLFQPNISKVTLHTWAKAGRIRNQRIGGRIYYKLSDIMESRKSLKKYKKECDENSEV